MISLLLATLLLAPQDHCNKLSFVVNYYQILILIWGLSGAALLVSN